MNEKVVYPRFRWVVFIALCLATMTNAVSLIAPATLIGPIAKALGVSLGETVGATMGTYNLFGAIACIAGGWFLDRFGVVRVWVVCLLLMIISTLLMPVFGTTILGLSVLRSIQSIGGGPIMGSAVIIAAEWFPVHERGIVTGITGVAMGLGIAMSFMIAPGLFESNGDWAVTMAWLSCIGIVALICTFIVGFGPKAPQMEGGEVLTSTTGSESAFVLALKQPATWAVICCVILSSWMFQGFNDIVPSYIAIAPPVGLGMGPMTSGSFMSIVQVASMIGAILSGFVVEKLARGQSKPVVFICFIAFAVFAFAIKLDVVTSSRSMLLGCLIMAGFFLAFLMPVSSAFIAKNYPEHISGRLGGLAQGLNMFGGTLGVTVGATALHITAMYQMSINIIIVVAIIGCFFSLGQNPPKAFVKSSGTVNTL
jgi:MFS family permease